MSDDTGAKRADDAGETIDAGIDIAELGADMAPAPEALLNSRPRTQKAGSTPFKTAAQGVPDDLGA